MSRTARTLPLMAVLATAIPFASALATPAGCEAVEARFRSARQTCLARAIGREARGLSSDARACEARRLARARRALVAAGCDDGGGAPEVEYAARPGAFTATAFVELPGVVRETRFDVVDGLAVIEGDIVLGTVEQVLARDAALRTQVRPRAGTRPGGSAAVWPNLAVPFEIDGEITDSLRARIESAVAHWNANTIIRLRARVNEDDFVRFVSGTGCSSRVGRQGGPQDITLEETCGRGSIIHEIGHAVGLFHEQSRNDRDQAVVVHLEHVDAEHEHNFQTYGTNGVDRRPFDFNSIMLYGSFAFSSDGEATMTRLDGTTFTAQRDGLSTSDIAGVTLMAVNMESAFTLKDKLKNQASSRCLEVGAGSLNAQAPIEQRDCTGSTRQRWHFFRHPRTGRQLLVNQRSGLCLDVPGSSTTIGRDLQQFPCHGGTSQTFVDFGRFFPTDPILLRNAASNLCVGLEGTGNGADVDQRACDTTNAQVKWFRDLF